MSVIHVFMISRGSFSGFEVLTHLAAQNTTYVILSRSGIYTTLFAQICAREPHKLELFNLSFFQSFPLTFASPAICHTFLNREQEQSTHQSLTPPVTANSIGSTRIIIVGTSNTEPPYLLPLINVIVAARSLVI